MLCILVCLLSVERTLAAVSVLEPEHTGHGVIALPCKATPVQGVQYRKVSWYKVLGSEYQGLVLKNLRTNQTTVYAGTNQSYALGVGFSLLLPDSAPDSAPSLCGTYQCTLWPPLGEYIQEAQYDYYPPGCVRPTEELPMMTSCFSGRSGSVMPAWGLPAALLLLCIASAVMFALYRQQRNSKEKETI